MHNTAAVIQNPSDDLTFVHYKLLDLDPVILSFVFSLTLMH
jgi:hypothetical protein